MYLNQATIIGNLTRDPELRALPDGTKVASFSMATNKSYKNKEGVKVESVEFHNIVAWGKAGELIAQYMKKGNQLMVQGELRTTSWDDKETGKKMYKTEINVRDFQFGYNQKDSTHNSGGQNVTQDSPEEIQRKKDIADFDKEQGTPTQSAGKVEYPDEDINPEDIPF
jgi:single-strand DNA-binding protein